jgi:flagellar motor switch protein FliN
MSDEKMINDDEPQGQEALERPEPLEAQSDQGDTAEAGSSVELIMVDGAGSDAPEKSTVKRAKFAPLQPGSQNSERSMDLLMDVQLDLRVELGRASVPVREVLQLGAGSIVSLDKLSGESVDVLVNGKLIARGEVVVVDENFGVRVTEMVNRSENSAQVG